MIKNRINKLIDLMEKNDIDAYIIPSADYHQSEYVANYFKSREFISGFSGSAGTVCILKDGNHGLWTDGRYFLQAEKELKGSGIKLFKMGNPDVKDFDDWLIHNLEKNSTIGFDGKVFCAKKVKSLKKKSKVKDIKIDSSKDLIDEIWDDRPEIPSEKVIHHNIKYSGKSTHSKLTDIRLKMEKLSVDKYILTSLDDIAWTFNLRGSDVEYNPVFLAYAIIDNENAILYIDKNKLDSDLKDRLKDSNVLLKDYFEIYEDVKEIKDSNILLSESRVNYSIYNSIDGSNEIISKRDITTDLKAVKNQIEQDNMANCFVRDGVAMVKFLKWLEENIDSGDITEITAQQKLSEFRSKQDYYKDDSFGSISGYQENGAIIHYAAKKETCKTLKSKGLYLIDSGGQYLDGTTDITRTIALGSLTKEQIRDYTLVLKGHINLSRVEFTKGTYGTNLDVLARQPLWEYGFDYNHGTGHGVGYFLNVHEGPQRIAKKPSNVLLKPGMVLSNEPGLYRKDEYGIRLENLVIIKKSKETEFGQFMKFKDLTLCPFDLNAIDTDLLDESDIDWINKYHNRVYDEISPFLEKDEKEWLKNKTKSI
ncbi:MAG: aminopeptidase P family protein [Bacillota bacterium]